VIGAWRFACNVCAGPTRRVATLAAVLAMLCGGALAAAASADAGSRGRAATADTAKRGSTACAKSSRARARCRRARYTAGYRRTKRRGRALLARPSIAAPVRRNTPHRATPSGTTSVTPGPAPGAAPIPVPETGPEATPPPDTSTPPGVASSVGAGAYDFGSFVLRLTRVSVPAGNLTIYFHNYDVSEHNLWIAPPAASGRPALIVSEAVGEHGGATKTVPVTVGTWRLYCSLTGHESMTRNLAVL